MDHRRPRPPDRTPRQIALTELDLELLRFLSEHRFVLADHAAALLGVTPVTAGRRLEKLADGGYARRAAVFTGRPPMYLIRPAGLRAVGSTLAAPTLDVHNYEHDIGVAWLWLAARRGTFGPLREILAERTLRSRDGVPDRDSPMLGVRLGGTGPHGRERLHYPDLLLMTADGKRVALELELSTKGRTRLESILAAYGADPRIAGVVYLVQSQTVARSVERAARRVGVSDLVHLQRVRLNVARPAAIQSLALERASGVSR
ncbi:MAG TPA: hypothetical protein VME22_12775 [Solirubrobacteraceae bacterium]|nr:hypothetical protein [Solirubrobacteraceae bacterium]